MNPQPWMPALHFVATRPPPVPPAPWPAGRPVWMAPAGHGACPVR